MVKEKKIGKLICFCFCFCFLIMQNVNAQSNSNKTITGTLINGIADKDNMPPSLLMEIKMADGKKIILENIPIEYSNIKIIGNKNQSLFISKQNNEIINPIILNKEIKITYQLTTEYLPVKIISVELLSNSQVTDNNSNEKTFNDTGVITGGGFDSEPRYDGQGENEYIIYKKTIGKSDGIKIKNSTGKEEFYEYTRQKGVTTVCGMNLYLQNNVNPKLLNKKVKFTYRKTKIEIEGIGGSVPFENKEIISIELVN